MTDEELEEKFRQSAQKLMKPERVDALAHTLWNRGEEPLVSGLIQRTVLQA